MGKKSNAARFPAARIKKIIQADEDVGKVAQGTPIVVSKALELFLTSLVAACVVDAEGRGVKKLTAHGLKRTINSNPTFDFCQDIVAEIPDPITPEEGAEKPKPKRKSRAKKVVEAKEEVDATPEEAAAETAEDEEMEEKPGKEDEEDYEE